MADLGSLLGTSSQLIRSMFRAMAGSGLGILGFSLLVSTACYFIAAKHSSEAGFVMLSCSLGACLAVGIVVAIKRAMMFVLRVGVRKMQLGRRAFDLIFERLLGVRESEKMGERGGLAAKALERVPLAQAEDKLRRVVKALLDADGKAGFFRKQLQAELLSKIEAVTLASFRKEGTKQGGLDLMEVRKQLQGDLDKRLEEIFSSARIMSTAIMLLVAGGVSLYCAFLVRISAR